MRILKSLRAACLFLIVFSGTVLAQDLPTTVIDALGRAGIPGHAIGTYVQEVADGPVLVAHNPHSAFNPASVMKLVTTDAALELLGPAFTWKTQAYVNGMQDGDVLHGDLVIRGGGDPKLTAEHLWSFLRRIRARGIRDIRGNLVLDRSAFEDIAYDPALFDGDPMRAYNAGPDALLLNYKALTFRFTPEEASGKVNFSIDPPIDGYAVAPPRLSNDECGDWRTKLMPMVDAEGARFDGALSMQCGERIWHVHPYQMTHAQYFGAVFRQLWTELGGKFKGDVRDGMVPPTAHLVAEWESASLSEVIRDINKYSNNVMARQLLLTIGHQALQLPATPERGAAIVRMWLANKGIDAPDLNIENGSGLSRNERISALTLGRLLGKVYQAPTMPEFISSMPLVGYDGTMRQRLNGYGVAGRAHIKTGTLNEVRAVAGYVLAASGKRYAVVSIVNHANASRAHEAQDALLQWVHEQG
jgi:D-alanyl-D-alanine carboxypeptidase/D-alanyl-D-alanine-endopeptidase (penicillin-binding protein 4)